MRDFDALGIELDFQPLHHHHRFPFSLDTAARDFDAHLRSASLVLDHILGYRHNMNKVTIYRLVVLGDGGVGKTALTIQVSTFSLLLVLATLNLDQPGKTLNCRAFLFVALSESFRW